MKKMFVAATLAIALVASSRAATRASDYKFSIGLGLDFTFSTGSGPSDQCAGGQCGPGKCGPGHCLPPPNWSPCYAPPRMYGGYKAMNPYQSLDGCYGAGSGGRFPGYAGVLHPGIGVNWMQPMPAQTPFPANPLSAGASGSAQPAVWASGE